MEEGTTDVWVTSTRDVAGRVWHTVVCLWDVTLAKLENIRTG